MLKSAVARVLSGSDEITAATMAGDTMVGRTELDRSEQGWNATLEYPVNYINVHPPAGRFQVDVSPILVPDFSSTSTEGLIVDRLRLAFVLYNQLNEVEFAVREPTVVSEGQPGETLHYSKMTKTAAKSTLFSLP